MQGWVKLHRCLLDKAIWKNSNLAQRSILITLLLFANHSENEWEWKGKQYICKSGEFITSADSIIKANNGLVTRQQVRTALAKFKRYEFLTIETTKTSTKITIVNWGLYQAKPTVDNQEDNQRPTNDQPTGNQQVTTNKNDKTVKNDKTDKKYISKSKYGEFQNVKLTDIEFEKLNIRYGKKVIADEIENLSTYLESNSKRYKSHYATLLAWLRRKGAKELNKSLETDCGYNEKALKGITVTDEEMESINF